MRNRNFTISKCYCPVCNTVMPVPRTSARTREKNHHKNLWCPVCQKEQNMIEIRDCDFVMNMLGEVVEA